MHRTETIDLLVVVSGEIDLVLETETVRLRAATASCSAAPGTRGRTRSRAVRDRRADGRDGRLAVDVFEAMRKRRMHRHYTPEPVPEELLEKARLRGGPRAGRAGRAAAHRRRHRARRDGCDPAGRPRLLQQRAGAAGSVRRSRARDRGDRRRHRRRGLRHRCRRRGRVPLAGGGRTRHRHLLDVELDHPPVQAVLGLPERIKPFLLVAVGYPAPDAPKAPRRFEPSVHRERWTE